MSIRQRMGAVLEAVNPHGRISHLPKSERARLMKAQADWDEKVRQHHQASNKPDKPDKPEPEPDKPKPNTPRVKREPFLQILSKEFDIKTGEDRKAPKNPSSRIGQVHNTSRYNRIFRVYQAHRKDAGLETHMAGRTGEFSKLHRRAAARALAKARSLRKASGLPPEKPDVQGKWGLRGKAVRPFVKAVRKHSHLKPGS